MFIPDPNLDFYPSRIPGQKGTGSRVKQAQDPGSAALVNTSSKTRVGDTDSDPH
jgi:hypothetical protein